MFYRIIGQNVHGGLLLSSDRRLLLGKQVGRQSCCLTTHPCLQETHCDTTETKIASLSCLLSEPPRAADEIHQYKKCYLSSHRNIVMKFSLTRIKVVLQFLLLFYRLTASTSVLLLGNTLAFYSQSEISRSLNIVDLNFLFITKNNN